MMSDNIAKFPNRNLVAGTCLEIKQAVWFTNMTGCICAVLCEDVVTGHQKAYIGVANGNNETRDKHQIAAFGTKLAKPVAEYYFGQLDNYRE
ncbi:MAG: hypothetical protein BV459_04970 [Thermoplasmata archaeon M11B2D]|nr:MAG: hypothetical protein BV459_04970 [Thermoplasmata archaeon M11B2D]